MTDTYMPVAPTMGGMGDSWAWIIILLLCFGGGMNGGFGGNNSFPWIMNGQNGINANTNEAFRDANLDAGIAGITAQLNSNMVNGMQNTFGAQTAVTEALTDIRAQLSQCCCDNRLATVQTQNIVQAEGAATRLAIQNQTQQILDKMCQQEIDALKASNLALQNQVNMLNLAASQTSQTATLENFIRANTPTGV
jgi:hypothetical protein